MITYSLLLLHGLIVATACLKASCSLSCSRLLVFRLELVLSSIFQVVFGTLLFLLVLLPLLFLYSLSCSSYLQPFLLPLSYTTYHARPKAFPARHAAMYSPASCVTVSTVAWYYHPERRVSTRIPCRPGHDFLAYVLKNSSWKFHQVAAGVHQSGQAGRYGPSITYKIIPAKSLPSIQPGDRRVRPAL